jgi:hypothetical protein
MLLDFGPRNQKHRTYANCLASFHTASVERSLPKRSNSAAARRRQPRESSSELRGETIVLEHDVSSIRMVSKRVEKALTKAEARVVGAWIHFPCLLKARDRPRYVAAPQVCIPERIARFIQSTVSRIKAPADSANLDLGQCSYERPHPKSLCNSPQRACCRLKYDSKHQLDSALTILVLEEDRNDSPLGREESPILTQVVKDFSFISRWSHALSVLPNYK